MGIVVFLLLCIFKKCSHALCNIPIYMSSLKRQGFKSNVKIGNKERGNKYVKATVCVAC